MKYLFGKRKWHIKPRIFVMLLLLLAIVFVGVFLAFNIYVSNYIRASVEIQLDGLVNDFGRFNTKPPPEPPIELPNDPQNERQNNPQNNPQDDPQSGFQVPNLSGQQSNRIGARGEVIILDADYQVMLYNELGENVDELTQIANRLKGEAIPLKTARNIKVDTLQGEYYISSLEDERIPGHFLVFFVSVAGINRLVETINLAMAVIVAAAMLICFLTANLIAGSVTKPLKKLSAFADEIGSGNFKRKEFSFPDLEFDELGEAMNQSAEKLDLYDKDQKTFFQNVSHELRTPLQSIRSYAEGVQYGLMDAGKSGATIIAETDRLSGIVEDLLYISRIDSMIGRADGQLLPQENDVRETLALCAELQKTLADKNGIRFIYQFDDQPVMFSYNEKHLSRAFSNLISNALRYAEQVVTLCCRQNDRRIEIAVKDDGPGISPEDLPHVFERFFKGQGGKHGIGLSIVKAAVELHGGTITAGTEAGASFTIYFDRTKDKKLLSDRKSLPDKKLFFDKKTK